MSASVQPIVTKGKTNNINLSATIRRLHMVHKTTVATADALEQLCLNDPAIYDAVMRQKLLSECRMAVTKVICEDRKVFAEMASPAKAPNSAPVSASTKALIRHNGQMLLDSYPLSCGKLLGDGDASEVQEHITTLALKATDMRDKIHWLKAILPLIKTGKTVRDSVTEAKIGELASKVKRDNEGLAL